MGIPYEQFYTRLKFSRKSVKLSRAGSIMGSLFMNSVGMALKQGSWGSRSQARLVMVFRA